jgi:DNA-binding SARP family transcriptional activator
MPCSRVALPWDHAYGSGEVVKLGLLMYLAATRSWQRRDTLATLFWPDQQHGEAMHNLRNLIHKVRAHAPWAAIELTEHSLRWQVHSDLVDF